MKNTYFITVSNDIITGNFYGDMTAKLAGYESHEKIEVSAETSVNVGDPVTFYNDWQRKTDKQLIDEGLITVPDGYILDGDHIREMTYDEKNPPKAIEGYSAAETLAILESLVQQRLNVFAQTLTYSSIDTACTYATSKNITYATEGQYCVEMRDETWAAAYVILNSMAGELSRDGKTDAELTELWKKIEKQLPALEWPL